MTGQPSNPKSTPSWIDLKIPLWGVIMLSCGLIGQSATLLIWGARTDDRVTQNTADIADIQAKLTAQAKLAETVARMDERTQALTVTINRIDARLDHSGSRRD